MENYTFTLILLLIPVLFIVAISAYSFIVKRPLGMTAKYVENRLYKISDRTLAQAVQLAMQKAGFKNIVFNERQAVFTAKVGLSFLSWGESVNVFLKSEPDGVAVKFMSVCSFPAQVMDWGKNKSNAENFFRELDKQLLNNASVQAA